MSVIDERIVKMKFDNKQFQEGVKDTMRSLEQLDTGVKLDNIAGAIDHVGDKFNTLGIIAMTAISKLTSAAIDKGKELINSIMEPILEGGKRRALNMEQAKFMFKGLGIDEETALSNANEAVLGTAYSLDAAAKAASMLGASGVSLGTDMTQALRAIAGTAAMTNSSYEDMAQIFTTIASNGKVMTYQLRQFSFRGMNMAAILAKELGISEQRVAAMVTDGAISWNTFYKAIYNQFGEFATKANETYEGAMANLRSAWARVGADFFTVLHETKRDVANATRPVVDEFNKALAPIKEVYASWVRDAANVKIKFLENFDMSNIKEIAQIIANLWRTVLKVKQSIYAAWQSIFPPKTEKRVSDLLRGIRLFTDALVPTGKQMLQLQRIFKGVFSVIGLFGDILKTVWTIIKTLIAPIFKVFGKSTKAVSGGFLEIFAWIGDLLVKFREWITESKVFTYITEGVAIAVEFVVNQITKWINAIRKSAIFQKFTKIIKDSIPKVKDWIANFRDSDMFRKMADAVGKAATKTVEWFKSLKDTSIYKKTASGIQTMTGKVREWFQTLRKSDTFNKIWIGVKDTFSRLKEQFSAFIQSPAVQSIIQKTKDVFLKVIEVIKERYGIIRDVIVKFFDDVRDATGKIDFTKVKEKFLDFIRDLVAKIRDFRGNVKKSVTGIFGAITGGIKDAKTTVGSFGDKIKKVFVNLGEYFRNFSLKDISSLITSIAGLKLVSALKILVFKPIEGLGKSITGIFKNISEAIKTFMGGVNKYLSAKAMAERSKAILNFAIAIGIMAGSLYILSKIPVEDLNRAAIALGVITGVMASMFVIMNVLNKDVSGKMFSKQIDPILQIAAAVIIFIGALILLTKLNTEGISEKLVILFGVVTGFVALSTFLSRGGSEKGAAANALGLIALAIAVRMLVKAIQAMIKVNIEGAEGKIIGIMVIIGSLMAMTRLAGKNAAKGGVALMAISVSLYLLIGVIKLIAKISDRDITKAIGVMTSLILLLSVFVLSTRFAGESANKAGTALIAVGAAVLLLSTSVLILSAIDPKKMIPALLAVDSMLLLMMGIIYVSKDTGNAHKTLLAVSTLALVLAGIMVAMALVEPKYLIPAMVALDMILAMVALVIYVADDATTAEGTLVVLAIFIAGVAAIIYGMTEMPNVDKALSVATALSEVLLAASAAAYVAEKIDPEAAMKGALGVDAVIILVGALFTFLGAIEEWTGGQGTFLKLIEKGVEIAAAIAKGIGQIIGSIIGGIGEGITNSLPKIGDNLSDFGKNLEPFVKTVSSIPSSFGDNIGVLTGAILALVGTNILDGISKFFSFGQNNLVSLGAELEAFAPSLKAFANSITGISPSEMTAAAEVMKGFGLILDAMPSSGGLAATIFGEKESLDSFGNGMVTLAESIISFQKTLKSGGGIDKDLVNEAATVGKTFAELESSLPTHGGIIKDWFSGDADLQTFGTQMVFFAMAIVKFQEELEKLPEGGVSMTLVNSAKRAGELMADLDEYLPGHPKGLKWLISSDTNLKIFGEQMVYFGRAIVMFQQELSKLPEGGVNIAMVESAKHAGELMADLDRALPGHPKGLKWLVSSDANLKTFSEEMVYFGMGIVAFQKQMDKLPEGGVNIKAVKSAKYAGELMAELDAQLPPHGGLVALWSGDNSLSKFGLELVAYGESLAKFSATIEDVSLSNMTDGITASDLLIELASKLEGSRGGLKSIWSHEYNFKDLGNELTALGNGLANFSNSVGGEFSVKIIKDVVPSLEELVRVAQGMGNIPQSAMTLFTADLKRVGEQGVTGFTEAFSGAESKLKTAMSDMLTATIKEAKNKETELAGSMFLTTNNALKKVGEAFEAYKKTIGSVISSFFTTILVKFREHYADMKSYGENIMIWFNSGVTSKLSEAKTKIVSPTLDAIAELKKKYQPFYDSGKNLVLGFIKGIEDNIPKVTNVGKKVGNAAINGARLALRESSPSRAFYDSGTNAVLGLVNALSDGKSKAEDAGHDMAFAAAMGLVTTLALIQSIMDDEIGEPTIRPILDLSDVRSNASELDRLMKGKSYSSKLAYSASNDIRDQQSYLGSTGFARLESAIQGLGGMGGTTYDINIKVEGDSLSTEKIKEIAATVEQEIKHINDKIVFSRGEAVRFA